MRSPGAGDGPAGDEAVSRAQDMMRVSLLEKVVCFLCFFTVLICVVIDFVMLYRLVRLSQAMP